MKNYYFTFGQDHNLLNGAPMKDCWVRVCADSYQKARFLFVKHFTLMFMSDPAKWAFQYEEEKFDRSFFPGGEYAFIHQDSYKTNQEE